MKHIIATKEINSEYIRPEIKVYELELEGVLCVSGEVDNPTEDGEGNWINFSTDRGF